MSSRHVRKVGGANKYLTPAAPNDDSDSDYEPLYSKKSSQSGYAGLVLSSNSESEPESPAAESSDEEVNPQPSTARKNKKKNKKSKARAENGNKLDEIDLSLMEVNDMLGPPAPGPQAAPTPAKEDPFKEVMAVQPRNLNVVTELNRLFGPEETDENKRSRQQRANILKKILVKPMPSTTLYDFKRIGLSMSLARREQDLMYFTFDHSPELQNMHKKFLLRYKSTINAPQLSLEQSRQTMHVEALLHMVDVLFHFEEFSLANEIVENVVAFLQHCAHPYFNLASGNVRLEYDVWENRPFHVAVLRYIYLLSNKACHRTALELAKMLFSLDPKDPLALVFVIDTLALRAREHQWLIDTIDYFNKNRETGILFNIQYSFALAHFHVAKKNKGDLSQADKLLQQAILSYPTVVTNILQCANISNPTLLSQQLYTLDARTTSNDVLNELIMVYAKLSWARWREPAVQEWLIRNATEVANKYANDEDTKARGEWLMSVRNSLLRVAPLEVCRHLSILSNMSPLILETTLTTFRTVAGWDPLLCAGQNRYGYTPAQPRPAPEQDVAGSALYRELPVVPAALELEPALLVVENSAPNVEQPAPNVGQAAANVEQAAPNVEQAAPNVGLPAVNLEQAALNVEHAEVIFEPAPELEMLEAMHQYPVCFITMDENGLISDLYLDGPPQCLIFVDAGEDIERICRLMDAEYNGHVITIADNGDLYYSQQ